MLFLARLMGAEDIVIERAVMEVKVAECPIVGECSEFECLNVEECIVVECSVVSHRGGVHCVGRTSCRVFRCGRARCVGMPRSGGARCDRRYS